VSVRFLADADLNNAVVQGVRRREPSVDFKSANEASLEGLLDPEVLELAARENRVLISQDRSTVPVHFAARLRAGHRSPGVLLTMPRASVGELVESLEIIWIASHESEWSDQIHYVPSLKRHVFR